MDVITPRWSSSTFLLYAGTTVVLLAGAGFLGWLSDEFRDLAYVGWTAIALAVAAYLALGLRRARRPIAAGLFANIAVWAFAAFVAALWNWFGWLGASSDTTLHGFHVARLLLLVLVLAAAVTALRTFRFPLIMATVAWLIWWLVSDLLSGGGDWSAVVSLAIGLGFLIAALAVDGGPRRPYGFWLHVAAGVTIGGALVYLLEGSSFGWIVVLLAALAYVRMGAVLGRSSWTVIGAFGVLVVAAHFTFEWTNANVLFFEGDGPHRPWAPSIVFGAAGLTLVVLGLLLARRDERRTVVAL